MNKSYIFFLFRNESSHNLHKILYRKNPEKSLIDYFHNFKIGGKKSDEKKKIQIHIFFPLNN